MIIATPFKYGFLSIKTIQKTIINNKNRCNTIATVYKNYIMNANSLSKDKILLHTNCNAIYTKFLGLNDFPKNNISSPFSDDKKPSFKVYPNGTFKCNSSTKQGDVWQFVAYLNNLDVKAQFNEVLNLVAKEMNIEHLVNSNLTSTAKNKPGSKEKTPVAIDSNYNCNSSAIIIATETKTSNNNDYSITEVQVNTAETPTDTEKTSVAIDCNDNCNSSAMIIATEKQSKKITVAKREFTILDLAYWHKLGVDKTILEKYKAHSISNYCWSGKKPIYTRNESVAFAFQLNENIKLYVPDQPEVNIKKNVLPPFPKDSIFGLMQLGTEKIENIIICEGEKDTIVANSRGFNTVTFGSGSVYSKQENIKLLQSRCNSLFVCFDADETGETGMQNLIKAHPEIIPIYLPKNDTIKGYDITDYFKEHTAQDFQKIIDLAVKNIIIVDVVGDKKFNQYELPKEVNEPIEKFINDIENYSMFIANSKIWILRGTEKKKYFREVSNFEIEIIQHMQDEIQPLKLVRIKNTTGLENIFDTLSDRLNSITKFDDMVTNFGNFLFTGVKSDFDILRAYLFAKMGNGRKIECLGWQKEHGFWLWNNKVNICDGNFIEIDENGIFIFNKTSFYVPSANKIYKNNSSKYEVQKGFTSKKPSIELDDYFKLFYEVYKTNSITAMLFTIASLFQDIVVKEIQGFPILFLKGIPSSGKDNLAFCCQSFLGVPQKAINVGSGVSTQKSQIRELAQFKNSISQFSEYKYGDKQLDEILKGIWDRNGYKIATIQSKTSTDTIPVDSALILTGNHNPVDDALITRLLWLEFNVDAFTENETAKYNELKDITKNGISQYYDTLLLNRNSFSDNFKEKFRTSKSEIDKLFPNAPSRISTNFAVLGATYNIFKSKITFPFTENEMIIEFTKLGNFQLNKINSASIINKWWDIFLECLKMQGDNKIQLDRDVKIADKKVYFNFSNVYGKIQRQWYNQYKESVPSKGAMLDIMLKDVSYLEKKDSFRFGGIVTSVYVFNVVKINVSDEFLEFVNLENSLKN